MASTSAEVTHDVENSFGTRYFNLRIINEQLIELPIKGVGNANRESEHISQAGEQKITEWPSLN